VCRFAFAYTTSRGLVDEGTYPYIAMQSSCPTKMPAAVSKLASNKALPVNNEAAMLTALKTGPIIAAMYADDDFVAYGGGELRRLDAVLSNDE
jgi:hypothetical protein